MCKSDLAVSASVSSGSSSSDSMVPKKTGSMTMKLSTSKLPSPTHADGAGGATSADGAAAAVGTTGAGGVVAVPTAARVGNGDVGGGHLRRPPGQISSPTMASSSPSSEFRES